MNVIKHSHNCSEGTNIIDTNLCQLIRFKQSKYTVSSCDASLSYQIIVYNKEQCMSVDMWLDSFVLGNFADHTSRNDDPSLFKSLINKILFYFQKKIVYKILSNKENYGV